MSEPQALAASSREGAEREASAARFEDFFRDERPHLFASLLLITGSVQDAEDTVQEAFFRLWERWDRVARMESTDGYLYTVALNLHRSRYRRTLRAARRALSSDASHDALEAIVARDELWRALLALPQRQREAVVVTALLGFTSDEAARMLHVAPGTVRMLASRGKASMKRDIVEPSDE